MRVVEGVVVEVEKQVILVAISKLFHFTEVPRLKLCVEEQGLVVNIRYIDRFRRRLKVLY